MFFRSFWTVLWLMVSTSCLAQATDWYPQSSLSCDAYRAETKSRSFFAGDKANVETLLRRDSSLTALLSRIGVLEEVAAKDLTTFTSSADFKSTPQKSLLSNAVTLSLYCTTHKNTILGDIDPLDVVRHPMEFMGGGEWKAQLMDASAWYKDAIATCGKYSQCSVIANNYREHTSACLLHGGNQAACDAVKKDTNDWAQMNSSSSQITSSDPALNKWVAESLVRCGSNTSCSTIVKSYQAHTIACSQGNQQACIDHDRDLKDWDVMSSSGAGAAQASGDARMQCLQNAMRQAVESCRQRNCPPEDIPDQGRLLQLALCGFSAIEPSKSYVAPAPQFPTMSDCRYTPRAGGGFNSTCTQY